ncbi:aerial mycelium formation protein [Cryptosporangium sp. NPDC051539]|uniref:aerial mycelium formation protein n=1 Tax=Cryptosporangium sp. NPDC051539 TaxID=3363962 RepID=UPI00378D87B9
MTDVVPGGKRRLDRVLDPGYLNGLADLRTSVVRHRRDEALAELDELSRLGHQLDLRIAMVTAEQRRRAAIAFDNTVAADTGGDATAASFGPSAEERGRLARVFRLRADTDGPPTHRRRRRVERLVADVDLADVGRRTDDELSRVLRTFRHERRQVTDVSGRVRAVVDRCGGELGRRRVAPMTARQADPRGARPAEEPEPAPDSALRVQP